MVGYCLIFGLKIDPDTKDDVSQQQFFLLAFMF